MTNDLLERMRSLEADHQPNGWPAVQMREISALCDEVERRFGIGGELIAARRERDELREKLQHAEQPAAQMDEAAEREAFEKWYLAQPGNAQSHLSRKDAEFPSDTSYYKAESEWQAWLARAKGGSA